MKQKTKNQKEESQKLELGSLSSEARFFFPAALIIIFILVFAVIFFNALFNEKETSVQPSTSADNGSKISVSTDKNEYAAGDKLVLHIENQGDAPIYFEPCQDVSVFEKKEGDDWVLKQGDKAIVNYQEADFEKKNGNTDCEIDLPKDGSGTYKVVLPVFYGCQKPSLYACEGAKVFHSNEFEIVENQENNPSASSVDGK